MNIEPKPETSMKSTFISIVATAVLLVTGGAMAAETPDAAKKPDAAKRIEMPDLAKKLNCNVCHDVEAQVVGPAWKEVAKKYHGQTKFTYNGKEYPLVEGLVMKVSKGGAGNWGSMPMPPNDQSGTKQAEITELINFEQSLWDK